MEIKEKWKNNPLYKQGKIELIPTEWVWKYYGKDVSDKADLIDGTIVDMNGLWENICKEGLYNPLIIRVGKNNKKFRLESGNHRIQLFHDKKIEMIPVTVQVKDECGPHLKDVMTDATHNFDFKEEDITSLFYDEYMKPSEVFKSLQIKI